MTVPADGGHPPIWNERLFETAGSTIEGVDIHRYTEGISGHTGEDGAREAWLDANDETPLGCVEVLVNDPGSWDAMFDAVRSVAADHGVDDLRITFGEWGLRAWEIEEGWPRASRGTMAHASFAARALQALLRTAATSNSLTGRTSRSTSVPVPAAEPDSISARRSSGTWPNRSWRRTTSGTS